MAKTNYSKVESAFSRGMHKIEVKSLSEMVDAPPESEGDELTEKQMITLIVSDLNWMHKQDKGVYKKIKIKKSEIESLSKKMENTKEKLTKKETGRLSELKKIIIDYKITNFPPKSDEEQVKDERNRHIYKRHNTQENWLPLDTHSDLEKF